MTYPLAILAPYIGARSETFIRRHMEDLLPGQTVVLAGDAEPPIAGHWEVDGPHMCLNRVRPSLKRQLWETTTRKLGIEVKEDFIKNNVTRFLISHGVRVILGEYLNWTIPWLDVAQSLGISIFAHAHGYDVSLILRDPKWRKEYLRLNECAGVITMSEVSKAKLVELGVDTQKIHVVPYGVDVPLRPLDRPQQDMVRCLAVGRMVSKKAPILLLDSFRRALENCPNLSLDYVGDGELVSAAQQFIRAFDMEDRVTLHGSQPSEVVCELMRSADIFLQHSMIDPITGDEEGLPVAILEAMANALPVVSTRHAGIPEAVIDRETGYLVEEGNSRQMGECLTSLAQDAALRQRIGRAGWKRARERFSWEQEAAQLRQILDLDQYCLTTSERLAREIEAPLTKRSPGISNIKVRAD